MCVIFKRVMITYLLYQLLIHKRFLSAFKSNQESFGIAEEGKEIWVGSRAELELGLQSCSLGARTALQSRYVLLGTFDA